jgi:hypothetical protein
VSAIGATTASADVPASWQLRSGPLRSVRRVMLPALVAADAIRTAAPNQYAHPVSTDLTPANSGSWQALAGGGRIWRVALESPGAVSMTELFARYRMPAGARIFIYTPDHLRRTVPFTSASNRPDGVVAAPPLPGDEVVVELDLPRATRGSPRFEIETVAVGFRTLEQTLDPSASTDPSESCEINVGCPLAKLLFPGISTEAARSVGLVILAGTGALCTGSLVNDTANDEAGYFLTANHCEAGTEDDWTIVFNDQTDACPYGSKGPTTVDSVGGVVLRANDSFSDFQLAQITDPIPRSFHVFYNGWDFSGAPYNADSFSIHHPRGAPSKFSDSVAELPFADFFNIDFKNWWLVAFSDGITESGSSGSPLFNEVGHVIGQLSGGVADCTFNQPHAPVYYGRFDVSWGAGGTPSSELSDWLDPGGVLASAPAFRRSWDGLDTVTGRTEQVGRAAVWLSLGDGPGAPAARQLDVSVSVVSPDRRGLLQRYVGELDGVTVHAGTLAEATKVIVPLRQISSPNRSSTTFSSTLSVRQTPVTAIRKRLVDPGPVSVVFYYGYPSAQFSELELTGSSQFMVSNLTIPFFFAAANQLDPAASPSVPSTTSVRVASGYVPLGTWAFSPGGTASAVTTAGIGHGYSALSDYF